MTDSSSLATTSPDALTALFEADPLLLSDVQLHSAIYELRRRRNAFTADEAAKSLKPKSPRAKPSPQTPAAAASANKPTSELGLDDLL